MNNKHPMHIMAHAAVGSLMSAIEAEEAREKRALQQASQIVLTYNRLALDYTDPAWMPSKPYRDSPRRLPTKAEVAKKRRKAKAAKVARKRNRP